MIGRKADPLRRVGGSPQAYVEHLGALAETPPFRLVSGDHCGEDLLADERLQYGRPARTRADRPAGVDARHRRGADTHRAPVPEAALAPAAVGGVDRLGPHDDGRLRPGAGAPARLRRVIALLAGRRCRSHPHRAVGGRRWRAGEYVPVNSSPAATPGSTAPGL